MDEDEHVPAIEAALREHVLNDPVVREDFRSVLRELCVVPVHQQLFALIQRRWPDPDPALRKFLGRDAEMSLDVLVGDLSDGTSRLDAFMAWATIFRRPQTRSRTLVEELLASPDLDELEAEYVDALRRASPSIWISRLESAGEVVLEEAFGGETRRVLPLISESFPAPGRAVPALLIGLTAFGHLIPVGPEMDAATARRAVEHLNGIGDFSGPGERVARAHEFGRLFAWFERSGDGESESTSQANSSSREGHDATAAAKSKQTGPAQRAKSMKRTVATKRTAATKRKRRSKRTKGAPVREDLFEFSVSLTGAKPSVRRRFLLRRDASAAELHTAIQDAFGWTDSHLWEFRRTQRDGAWAGAPYLAEGDGWNAPVPDARRVPLTRHFRRVGDSAVYVYDFGDDWVHRVSLLGGVDDPDVGQRRLLAGRGACPPEDCGGVWGLERMRLFRQTGEDPWDDLTPEELDEWLGDWESDAFDLEEARAFFDR